MTDSGERERRLAEIRARLAESTPGPWVCAPWSSGTVAPACWLPNTGTCVATVEHDRDKKFIAHAPEDIAFLLAALVAGARDTPPAGQSEDREWLRGVIAEFLGDRANIYLSWPYINAAQLANWIASRRERAARAGDDAPTPGDEIETAVARQVAADGACRFSSPEVCVKREDRLRQEADDIQDRLKELRRELATEKAETRSVRALLENAERIVARIPLEADGITLKLPSQNQPVAPGAAALREPTKELATKMLNAAIAAYERARLVYPRNTGECIDAALVAGLAALGAQP